MARLIRTTLLSFIIGGAWYVLLVTTAFALTLALDGLYEALGAGALLSTTISMLAGAVVASAVVGTAARRTGLLAHVRSGRTPGRRDDDLEVTAAPVR